MIRAFSRQASEKADYEAETGELLRAQVRAGRLSALLNPATSAIVNAAIALLVWQGGYRVFAGGITQGEVVALVNYMTQILVALLALSNLIVQMARGSASRRAAERTVRAAALHRGRPGRADGGRRERRRIPARKLPLSWRGRAFAGGCFLCRAAGQHHRRDRRHGQR